MWVCLYDMDSCCQLSISSVETLTATRRLCCTYSGSEMGYHRTFLQLKKKGAFQGVSVSLGSVQQRDQEMFKRQR